MTRKSNNREKIIHYLPVFRVGGIERYIETIVKNVDEYQHEIITETPSDKYVQNIKECADFKSLQPKQYFLPSKKLMKVYNPINALNIANSLYKYLKSIKWDLLHVHMIGLGELKKGYIFHKWVLSNIIRKRYQSIGMKNMIFTDHTIFLRFDTLYEEIDFYLNTFDNIICVEKKGYENVLSWMKQTEKKKNVWYVPNSVDTEIFCHEKRIDRDKLVIGFASRLIGRDGTDLLMEFISKMPDYVEMHISSLMEISSHHIYKELNSNPHVKFYPNVPYNKMPDFYHNIDVLLDTLPLENIGRNTLESMACGRPVIRIRKGDRYPVIDGETGYIVDNNVDSILNKIAHINKNRNELDDFGKDGVIPIKKEFSNDIVLPRLKEIYNLLIEK